MTSLAISRIAILKNHRKARASYAFSDVSQLLNLGYHDQALVRVEQWIVEQNMLDAFVMIEDYCNVLRERAQVLENHKECPFDLKEATCSLIFASSRCGEFPELHKIQEILTSKFGKEFADHAIRLHKTNGVNSEMIQKLSSRHPTLEIKMEALKKISSEIGVTLPIKKNPTLINKDKLNVDQRQHEVETKNCSSVNDAKHEEDNQHDPNQNMIEEETKYCSSVNDAKHEEENQHDDDQNVIKDNYLFDVNEERRRNKYAAAAVQQALELASFEISKYSNHKQKDIVISKRNYRIDIKEESQISQNPRDEMKPTPKNATNLVSKENVEENANRDNDHKSESNAARENEDLSEEKAHPSSHAIRWNNQQRSQTNHSVRTYFPKKMNTHHEHLDWKMMSVRTR
ncbi:unnamed protein product [Trifolium pratense]|uniref:Uncharacterized protein n=1 Tax=Trifolium pratense TaxID=57577 RepID=A0ACB0LHD0_TRIPR|nr:unnamed protein product [Trifolium pratense]